MSWKQGKWKNGTRTVTGQWLYVWHRDCFIIALNSNDPITGEQRKITTSNDSPEWGKWKLIEK